MALIPIKIGNVSALIEKPDPPRCSVPGCRGDHWTNCDYPVVRGGKAARCDAKLCEEHVVLVKDESLLDKMEVCPAHSRWIARAGK